MTDILFPAAPASLFQVTGADARRYLHGRVTQAVKSLKPGEGTKSLLLSPQGKIQGQFLLLCEGEDFLLLSDPLPTTDAEDTFLENLLRFKVADRVTAEKLSMQYSSFHLRIENAQTNSALGISLPKQQWAFTRGVLADREVIAINDPWGAEACMTMLVKTEDVATVSAAILARDGFSAGNALGYERSRIENKIPLWGIDIDDKVLGSEVNYEELISFSKGCYAGQEAIEMSVARGRPPRRLVKFEAKEELPLVAGTPVTTAENGAACGVITSSITAAEFGTLALGFVKNNEPVIAAVFVNDVQLVVS